MTTTSKPRATVTVLSDTEIEIERTFDAPAQLVWDVWNDPKYMARWYGPRSMTMVACEIDLREGGGYRWTMRGPDGNDYSWKGTYRELQPPTRMISTEAFLLGDAWTNESVNHVSFEERDGKTHVTNRVVYASKADRDGHLGAGMEGGMNETFERFDELLASLQG
jgi:uncharacterized protein YndB with AHSA1/START domain